MPAKHPLRLNIVSASSLCNAYLAKVKTSDLCCALTIKSRSNPNCTTPVVKDCVNPRWNFPVEVEDYEIGDVLEFAIVSKNSCSGDVLFGKTFLSCAQWGHPDGFEGELRIQESSRKDAWLYVIVEPLGMDEPVKTTSGSSLLSRWTGSFDSRIHGVSSQVDRISARGTNVLGRARHAGMKNNFLPPGWNSFATWSQ